LYPSLRSNIISYIMMAVISLILFLVFLICCQPVSEDLLCEI
jgi:hypothetical protein